MQLKLYWLEFSVRSHSLQAQKAWLHCFSQLIREIRSDEFYIPGFSTDELDIFVSTSSTM